MLRIHFMQQWFTLSDPAMEDAVHDMSLYRECARMGRDQLLPVERTILRFRDLLEKHKLADQILASVNDILVSKGLLLKDGLVVDVTPISAPSATRNESGRRDPQTHQSKKGNQRYFGMKAHIGADADSGLVHTVRGTAGNLNDAVEASSLLHVQERAVFGDSGYQVGDKRPDANHDIMWHVALRPGKRKALQADDPADQCIEKVERLKASVGAKVDHPSREVKCKLKHVKVRHRGPARNTAQFKTLYARSNLW